MVSAWHLALLLGFNRDFSSTVMPWLSSKTGFTSGQEVKVARYAISHYPLIVGAKCPALERLQSTQMGLPLPTNTKWAFAFIRTCLTCCMAHRETAPSLESVHPQLPTDWQGSSVTLLTSCSSCQLLPPTEFNWISCFLWDINSKYLCIIDSVSSCNSTANDERKIEGSCNKIKAWTCT